MGNMSSLKYMIFSLSCFMHGKNISIVFELNVGKCFTGMKSTCSTAVAPYFSRKEGIYDFPDTVTYMSFTKGI